VRIDAARDDAGVSSEVPNLLELTATTGKNRFDFLQKDLALCLTFVDLARTELEVDGPEAARRVIVKAELQP